jgi:hypothetical protein
MSVRRIKHYLKTVPPKCHQLCELTGLARAGKDHDAVVIAV